MADGAVLSKKIIKLNMIKWRRKQRIKKAFRVN